MNYFAISGLVNFLMGVTCGLLVFLSNPRGKKNRLFLLFSFAVAMWAMGYFLWQLAGTKESALFWLKVCISSAILVAPFHFHLYLAIFNLYSKIQNRILISIYVLAIPLFLASFSSFVVVDVVPKSIFPFWGEPGLGFSIHTILFNFSVFYSHGLLVAKRKSFPGPSKKALGIVLIGATVGYGSGISNFFLWWDINVIPYSNILVAAYTLSLALVFVQFKFLDIADALKKTLLLSLIYLGLIVLSFPVVLGSAHYLLGKFPQSEILILISLAIALGGILSLGPLIYARLLHRSHWIKTQMEAGYTHELRSPLGVIQNAIEILEEELAQQPNEKTRDYLKMIQANSRRLEKTINQTLEIRRIEEGRIEISKKPTALDKVLSETISEAQEAAPPHIKFVFEKNDQQNEALIDSEKIHLVVSNLLSNALKFTQQGEIHTTLLKNGSGFTVSVKDSGPGINPSEKEKIFEKYFSGPSSRSGMGLGLSIARSWVEAHGGRIWAESEGEGKGTKVSFTIPL